MEVQHISHSEHVTLYCILCCNFFIMDHCSTKLAERNYPVSSVCVCVCVCVCVSVSKWCGFR